MTLFRYQMNEAQLQTTVNLNGHGGQPARGQDPRAKSPPQGKVNILTFLKNNNHLFTLAFYLTT